MGLGNDEELTKAKAAIQDFKEALEQGRISGTHLDRAVRGVARGTRSAGSRAQQDPRFADPASEIVRSGRRRPLWTVPASEIKERREGWLQLLEGKTAAEIQGSNGFRDLTVHLTEVWLWAIAGPALSITCTEEGGRWGPGSAVDHIPEHLQAEVAWWRSNVAQGPARRGRLHLSTQVAEDFGHVVFDELRTSTLTGQELTDTIDQALDVKGMPRQSDVRLAWHQALSRVARSLIAGAPPVVIGRYQKDPLAPPESPTAAADRCNTARPGNAPSA